MAVTSLWKISGEINKVILYAENENKTTLDEVIETDLDTSVPENVLNAVIDYANRDSATNKKQLVSGINCDPKNASYEMMKVKKAFGKTGGTVAYHGYQSFKQGEVDAETAHLIGCNLAENLWGDKYQVVVCTHLDKESHIHNHFVINTVSFVDGKKFHRTKQDYRNMREESDKLCKEHGLSVITYPQNKKKNYVEYMAEKNGLPTKNSIIKADIDECVVVCQNEKMFYREMARRGYTFDFSHKYATISHPGFAKARRLKTLGLDYTPERIADRIYANWRRKDFDYPEQDEVLIFPEYFDNIQTIYINFVLIIDNVRNRKDENRDLYRLLGDEIIKFDKWVEEQNLLLDNDIHTDNELKEFTDKCKEEFDELTEARRILRNKMKCAVRAENTEEQNELRNDISVLSARLGVLRKQLKVCERIIDNKPKAEEKLHEIHEMNERKAIEKAMPQGRNARQRIR